MYIDKNKQKDLLKRFPDIVRPTHRSLVPTQTISRAPMTAKSGVAHRLLRKLPAPMACSEEVANLEVWRAWYGFLREQNQTPGPF